MTKYFNYSKLLHFATLCCFLLPFFYTGCEPRGEKKDIEKERQDSIAIEEAARAEAMAQDSTTTSAIDTLVKTTILQEDTTSAQPDVSAKSEEKSDNISEKISNKFPFLRPVLNPSKDVSSGIASVIDSSPYIIFFAVFISFLFLIIALIVKFIDVNARNTIVLIEILALISLIISSSFTDHCERLWGFWTAITFVSILSLYDLYLIWRNKHKQNI